MDVAIVILVIAAVLGIACVAYDVKSENEDLKGYLEFYKKQLKATLASLESSNECLQEAVDEYRDLSERYHELFVAYERACTILEEHDLLPEDEE